MDKKWVIVFLIYADFRTKESFSMSKEMRVEINEMLKDIIKVPLNPDHARVFVILNGIKYFFPETAKTPEIVTKSALYEITKCRQNGDNCLETCEIINNGPNTIQNAHKLANVLKYITVRENEEVFLITWDHGSAFGIFRDTPVMLPQLLLPINDQEELRYFPYLRMFWEKALQKEDIEKYQHKADPDHPTFTVRSGHELFTISVKKDIVETIIPLLKDEQANNFFKVTPDKSRLIFDRGGYTKSNASNNSTKGTVPEQITGIETVAEIDSKNTGITEVLHNHELADAIGLWLGEKKVGVLLMMNCWMMNLHNMYAMRDRVECLVAPQGDIASPGYNYHHILKFIYHPGNTFDARKLAEICVVTTENSFAQRRARRLNRKFPDTIDTWKIIAVDLQKKHIDGNSLLAKQLESLKALVSVLVDHFKIENEGNNQITTTEFKYMLKYIRSVCHDFTNKGTLMVDILNWCLSIKSADKYFLPAHSRVIPDIEDGIVDFRNLVFDSNDKIALIIKATRGKSVYAITDPLLPIAVINLEPSGYSLFFPQYGFSNEPNLLDNVRTDRLLSKSLEKWKEFLTTVIDAEITF